MRKFPELASLRHDFSLEAEQVDLGFDLYAKNFSFVSKNFELLQKIDSSLGLLKIGPTSNDPTFFPLYRLPDAAVTENQAFRYHLILPKGVDKAEKLIVLVHGFNERGWAKYMPWAAQLVKRTGQGVLLFPLAFHMNRAPALWNDPRAMKKVSAERKVLYPDVLQSTLSNAAISVRLHANPARFFWSGLVSYHDIVALVKDIRAGGNPAIAANAPINFFTYSIGTLLGEIVLFTNEDQLFTDSKLVAFCGGPVFNRLSPVTKFILDSEANVRLYSFLVEHLESHRKVDPELDRHLSDAMPVGRNFRCLLNYRVDLAYREERFRALAKNILGLSLAQDDVVPPYEIIGTFNGSRRDIPIPVEVLDPPFPLRHEDPFPAAGPSKGPGEAFIDDVFARSAEFLG
ncbi:MAG: DUF6051 family protein [Deltaproteobacteria bacterium]|jgi:hypothetical protein|nr:DUF6051 family protein [Deltaproteobacteria bacterium]